MSQDVLFLVHRIPFPPDKGDKIRSYHLLKYLSERCRVHLGCFVDDDNDWQYLEQVKSYCTSSHILPLKPLAAKLNCLPSLLTNEALSLGYYRNANMKQWVNNVMSEVKPTLVLAYSSVMAQYVDSSDGECAHLMDFVDMDSDKWRQYAASKRGISRWIYAREAERLLAWETKVATEFDASFFISERENQEFLETTGPIDGVQVLRSGVDAAYFDPELAYENPYGNHGKRLVFTGAMDYWANEEAAVWFVQQIFQALRRQDTSLEFYIVGSSPTDTVKNLAKIDGVTVTGRVADIRPYLAYADLVVTPLRIARGIQNKVLEALAMGKRVVASEQAMAGIDYEGCDVMSTEFVQPFVDVIAQRLQQQSPNDAAAREFVLTHYDWTRNLSTLDRWLES